jgi:hypothetical protein
MFVYGGTIEMQYTIIPSLIAISLYSTLLFLVYKFLIKNNYMLIPFMVLFERIISTFSSNELGTFNSYPNEALYMVASYLLGVVVWVQLTKFFFDTDQ